MQKLPLERSGRDRGTLRMWWMQNLPPSLVGASSGSLYTSQVTQAAPQLT